MAGRVLCAIAAIAALDACVNRFWRTDVREIDRQSISRPTFVSTPVRAHLLDGGTIVYRNGVRIDSMWLIGQGEAYALLSDRSTPRVVGVPLDSVVGLETFEAKLLAIPTIVTTVGATAIGAAATAALGVAIFGSCPTLYADTGTGPVLQAEGFSYAIAPLLEHRDLDAIAARPDRDGIIRLELRNEALETHYLNHIQLLAITHDATSRALPDESGRPVLVGAARPASHARDRAGRDVLPALATADDSVFSSDTTTENRARVGDLDDWIDLEADDVPPSDSVAVVLRVRNSLLNTVLLYDGMLGGRDAPDWLASTMQHISAAVDVASWYTRTMGMRAVESDVQTGVRPWHARLGDTGPIAWHDVAIVLPRPRDSRGTVRVRLRFVADDWRIDYAAIAPVIGRPTPTVVPLTRVVVPNPGDGRGPLSDSAAANALGDADDAYLETRPGQRLTLEFSTPAADASASREHATSYFVSWQGWYNEWLRGRWLARPARTTAWTPGDSAVLVALHQWRAQRAWFERQFYDTRIPVR